MTRSSQRKAFEYWSTKMPGTVQALRRSMEQIAELPVSDADKRALTASLQSLCTVVATDVDRLHNDEQTQRTLALCSLLGSVFDGPAT